MRGTLSLLLSALLSVGLAAQEPSRANESLDGFVPISQLPPSEQLPAAPYLIVAYLFVWLAVTMYLWSLWRRLNRVEAELRAVKAGLP
jgi:CcmD family protein